MRLARTLNILEGDRQLAGLLGLLHFVVAAAYSFLDIGATSLLIGYLGPQALPQVYLLSAFVLILVGLFIIPLIDKLHRAMLFSTVLASFSIVLLSSNALASTSPEIGYRALYVVSFLMKGLVFLQFWLLAGDLCDIRQAKRLFPVLLGFSLAGGLTASLSSSLLPRFLNTETLVTVAGSLLLAGLVPIALVSRRWRHRFRPTQTNWKGFSQNWSQLKGDLGITLSSPLLRTLSLSLLLLALLAQVLDYLMGTAAHVQFTAANGAVDLEGLTTFYALLNAIVIGLGTLVQFLFANRVISSLGVTRGLLLAPFTVLGAFLVSGFVLLVSAGLGVSFFITVLSARALQKVTRISIVRTSTDLTYNAIPAERRGRAKAFKETLIEPLGVLIGGLLLIAATALPIEFILGGGLLLSVVFLLVTFQLRDHYLESLVHILKEKSRFRFAFPSIMMRKVQVEEDSSNAVSGLRRALENDEASVRLLAVEVAAELHEPEASSLLMDHFREEPDARVRARMVNALGTMLRGQHEPSGDESLSDLDPRVRASGMESLAQSGIIVPEELHHDTKSEPDAPPVPEQRADAYEGGDVEAIPGSNYTPSSQAQHAAGQYDSEPVGGEPRFVDAQESYSKALRRRSFLELARSGDRQSLERLVAYLDEGDGATRHLAARALESCGEPAIGVLTLALWSADVEGRRYVIRALSRIGTRQARQALLPVLSLEAEEAYYDLVRLEALTHFSEEPSIALLKDSISQRVSRAKRNAHQILRSVFIAEPGMRLILSNLTHPDPYVRSSAIEALEMRVDDSTLGGVLPLFEHENAGLIAEHGSSMFELPSKPPRDVLDALTRHRSPWIRACAIYALGRVGGADAALSLEARLSDDYELAQLNAVEALGRLGSEKSVPELQRLPSTPGSRLEIYARQAIASIRARASQ